MGSYERSKDIIWPWIIGLSVAMGLMIKPLKAQNLIPNPRFEQITDCQKALNVPTPIEVASPWYNPNQARYNANYYLAVKVCLPPGQWIDQDAPFPNGFISTTSTYQVDAGQVVSDYGTYASAPLTATLEVGRYYWFSMRAIIANGGGSTRVSQEQNSYGLLLSDQQPVYANQHMLPLSQYQPQIIFSNRYMTENRTFSSGYNDNVAARQLMQGCFQAQGNERYLTIGDFLHPSYTDRNSTLQFTDLSLTKMPDRIDLGADTSICQGQPLTLKSNVLMGQYNPTYRWQNGSTDSTLSVTRSGLYSLTITCSCRTYTDSIRINVEDPNLQLGPDTSVCQGNPIVLIAGDGFDRYRWSNGSTASTLTVDKPGVYQVEVERFGCLAVDSIQVYSSSECCQLYLPSAFSPNADGINDNFMIITGCSDIVREVELFVYNRWGEVIFKTQDIKVGWNGGYQGTSCGVGPYTWQLTYTLPYKKSVVRQHQRGIVMLVK
ncbi:T9SS C-terminal target domain-containing protein [Spirosoma linguale]|uniref:Gliding motility-associated C-terminal domain-containing protein n=1 Tax=Spirosoma linguale (strain ATCC 33905 / DSM 74 / LMG 10896 / Claus 1) TaxID=504472 RepID=D2QC13_SPILD|nr:hypothetical protein Slin_3752 [Spirosoma linguale DSM 74]